MLAIYARVRCAKEIRPRREKLSGHSLCRFEFGLYAEGRHCGCAGAGAGAGLRDQGVVFVAGKSLSVELEGFADELVDTVVEISDECFAVLGLMDLPPDDMLVKQIPPQPSERRA